jgi:hypothetical protein
MHFVIFTSMNNSIRAMLLFMMALTLPSLGYAHNYLATPNGGQATIIPDISVSRAAYRSLDKTDQVDIYQFAAKKGQELYIQMTVPLLDREQGFAPDLVLVYTGSDQVAFGDPRLEKGTLMDPAHDVVDRLHPHLGGNDAEPPLLGVSYDGSAPLVFNEPFTGTRYWIRETLTVAAPADGTYRIGVYSRNGQTGKYVLAPGKREKFGLGDVAGFESVRIKVRTFCEEPVWPEITVLSVLGAAVLGGAGLLVANAVRR